ncbi:unnamed protein product [Ilex paraguariensis]|uniref:Transmembrane protein n=1 Tax=Ilex paraguariensis TaxID=185542 RepID=A0ABC8R9Y8_9AQUA
MKITKIKTQREREVPVTKAGWIGLVLVAVVFGCCGRPILWWRKTSAGLVEERWRSGGCWALRVADLVSTSLVGSKIKWRSLISNSYGGLVVVVVVEWWIC